MADSAWFECRLRTLRFVVIQYFFVFKWDELRVTRVVQLFLHLRLNYYEAKIQMLSVFSWNPAQLRCLKIKIKVCSFWELIIRHFCLRDTKLNLISTGYFSLNMFTLWITSVTFDTILLTLTVSINHSETKSSAISFLNYKTKLTAFIKVYRIWGQIASVVLRRFLLRKYISSSDYHPIRSSVCSFLV